MSSMWPEWRRSQHKWRDVLPRASGRQGVRDSRDLRNQGEGNEGSAHLHEEGADGWGAAIILARQHSQIEAIADFEIRTAASIGGNSNHGNKGQMKVAGH